MKITVTQSHIDQGIKKQCERCPIALAMLEAGYFRPHVYEDCVVLGAATLGLPDEAKSFVAAFDAGRPVEPFAFELLPPF